MGDNAISRVEKLLAYDFGDESDYCIDLAVAAGELLSLARSNREALDKAGIVRICEGVQGYKGLDHERIADALLDRLSPDLERE